MPIPTGRQPSDSPRSLRDRAARIRQHAEVLQDSDAARLRELADELEERAVSIEAHEREPDANF